MLDQTKVDTTVDKEIQLKVDNVVLKGQLIVPVGADGLIIFSHGAGSSRFSPRNMHVAHLLHEQKFGTFLFDLLTEGEDAIYENRFNIDLLTQRLVKVTEQIQEYTGLKELPVGYFGASTGAASALKAATLLPEKVKAVISRGGRPDLAMPSLPKVKAAVLLIVGSLDITVLALNKKAFNELTSEKQIAIVNGATHLFEEPGKLDEAARLSIDWFKRHL